MSVYRSRQKKCHNFLIIRRRLSSFSVPTLRPRQEANQENCEETSSLHRVDMGDTAKEKAARHRLRRKKAFHFLAS